MIKDGDYWVINGMKIWISNMFYVDWGIVMVVIDFEKGLRGGIIVFFVDKDIFGFFIVREILMIGGVWIYEVVFDECWVYND